MSRGPSGLSGFGIVDHAVAGVAAADPRRLHPPRGGQVGRPEAHPLHARTGGRDLLEVDHAEARLEDGVDQDGALESGSRLELGQQPVDVVDVPRALDLGDHHHVELVTDLAHQGGDVLEHPGRLEAVDPGPQLRLAQLHLLADAHEALTRRLLAVDRHGVLEVAQQDVDRRRDVGHLGHHLLVGEIEEVDHPGGLERYFQHRRRSTDGERFSEVTGVSHAAER